MGASRTHWNKPIFIRNLIALSFDAIMGITAEAVPKIPVDSFVQLRHVEALYDRFGFATVAQITSLPHFYAATPSGMFKALENRGEHLASSLSAVPNSLWFWSGKTNVTKKILGLKHLISEASTFWTALYSHRPASDWNMLHLASVRQMTNDDFQTLMNEGLPAPALSGLNTLFAVNETTFSKVPASGFQYFLRDSAAFFTAQVLNRLPLEAMEAFTAEMYSAFNSFDGLDASHVASLDVSKLQYLDCSVVLSIKPEQLVSSRQAIIDELNRLRKYSCQDGYLPPITAGPIVVPPPYHDNMPTVQAPSVDANIQGPVATDAKSLIPFIIGASVGGAILIVIVIVVVLVIRRRQQRRNRETQNAAVESDSLKKPLMDSHYNSFPQ